MGRSVFVTRFGIDRWTGVAMSAILQHGNLSSVFALPDSGDVASKGLPPTAPFGLTCAVAGHPATSQLLAIWGLVCPIG